jgi:hypothetical protein
VLSTRGGPIFVSATAFSPIEVIREWQPMKEEATAAPLSDHSEVTKGMFPTPTPAEPIPATLTAPPALVKVTAVPPSIAKAVLQIVEVVGAGIT